MPNVKKRFYEIAPGWSGGSVAIRLDDWFGTLSTSESFKYLETLHAKKIAESARVMAKQRAIPDLVNAGTGTPIVTFTMKSVLEAVGPGETEFRPFALRWQDGTPVQGEDRFLCNVLNRADCFDFAYLGREPPHVITVTPSGKTLTPEESWLTEAAVDMVIPRPNYIDPSKVSGLHIWRPRWCATRIFVTADLLKALRDAGVKGLHVDRLFTRDDPQPKARPRTSVQFT
jgi:hypothetical protein